MRFRHPDGTVVHLSYCTNVHPADDLDGVIGQLDRYAVPVRERLAADRLGLGLWLPETVATPLAQDPSAVAGLRAGLTARGLEVVSLNGFPYQDFHAPVVKRDVYLPDWSHPARLDYTLDLAAILTGLLPDTATRGSISTLPFGWRTWWPPAKATRAAARLDELATALSRLGRDHGRVIRVGFEPEPGCVVERGEEAVRHLTGLDTSVLGVCLDSCHSALAFEEPEALLGRYARAGIPVVKLQASCALHAQDPTDPATADALAAFVEPRFLHQTREQVPGGVPHSCDDLDEALRPGRLPGRSPWRVHFHLPLHAEPQAPLRSTVPVLDATLTQLFGGESAGTDHVEVETYTWSVLPEEQRPDTPEELADGIAAELDWARRRLIHLGLKEVPG
ncbi:Xylose isomerase-like TIM barrel [Streptomyces sp. SceaMP-e96]|uniref:metabolite traffic protein EboE n=1 Tax=Streptomyces TaxID=1883 RepID=UPI000823D388|nr:metabolite traffic protein EboE [Streptomyces sp. SceaMP-e96]MYT16169.1 metabolite traffic protein EboE [Streptomyces sp. SID4951]SCK30820.1 Xylose isomerase-like TIM barrel [Streptomyces sp. SceaMP-e96]